MKKFLLAAALLLSASPVSAYTPEVKEIITGPVVTRYIIRGKDPNIANRVFLDTLYVMYPGRSNEKWFWINEKDILVPRPNKQLQGRWIQCDGRHGTFRTSAGSYRSSFEPVEKAVCKEVFGKAVVSPAATNPFHYNKVLAACVPWAEKVGTSESNKLANLNKCFLLNGLNPIPGWGWWSAAE